MEHELDAVIESLKDETPAVTQEPEKDEQVKDESEDQADSADQEDESKDIVFPKKAVNAISYRNKIIARERAEKAAILAEKAAILAELEQLKSQAKPQNIGELKQQSNGEQPPKEEDFSSYPEYVEAKVLYNVRQELAKQEKAKQEAQTVAINQEALSHQQIELSEKIESHKQGIPDFTKVIEESLPVINSFPEFIERAFLEADDGALAMYNLAKDGKLESLFSMSPYRVAMEVAKAQIPTQQTKMVSSAPMPISSTSGRGVVTKSVDRMSGEELLKKYGIS